MWGWTEVSMRTMAEVAGNVAVLVSQSRLRAGLVVLGILLGAAAAGAQEVSVEFAENNLAPAAEEMANAGVDGSIETAVAVIGIAQRYGFGYGISPDEVRELVGGGYLAVRQIDCSSLDARAAAAQRLSRVLTAIAWMYGIGAGLTIAAPPVAAALGFGAFATGVMATAAGWLATEFRTQRSQVKCTKEGGVEWFRPAAREIRTALDPAVIPSFWRRSSGVSPCA
jgi:hypothetical protein